jgi:beta-glucosidase
MTRQRSCLLISAVLMGLLVGCGEDRLQTTAASAAPPTPTPPPTTAQFCQLPSSTVEARIDALLPQMTLAEKVDQMHGNSDGRSINGLWYTPDNDRLGIPGLRMVDGPRGVSRHTGHATAFPVAMARGATWDPALEARVGDAIGEEVRAKGGSVLLAPVTAVLRHPLWGRAQETYGEDPLAIGRMGVGFIHGAQQHVIASVKHFALNSIEDARYFVNVVVDERTLREIYLPQFRMAVQEGHVGSVMSAYNRVNGPYCGENVHLLHDILKGEWGFQGFVESDWSLGARSTVPAALAGLDIEMPTPYYYGAPLLEAVNAGSVPEATINEAVRRILRTKFCYHLDTQPPVVDPAAIESAAHTNLALEVARQAIVLLKNAGGVLPLDRRRRRSVAVVGPLADVQNIGDSGAGGSSAVEPSYVVTALQGIRNRAGQVTVNAVTDAALSDADRAVITAADAAIVAVGFTGTDEGEDNDRKQLALPTDQEQLIADVAGLNGTTIVVLEGGSAISVEPWVDQVAAVVMAWYPGQEGGNAIADVLFGDVNPSAKLPISFVRSVDDLPPFPNHASQVTYGYYHGYRLLDHNGVEPRFPFGFGLSYTTYRYANLRLPTVALAAGDTLHVTTDVTNTGAIAGDEIVQLYVGYQGSRIDRPLKDLKGFTKVHLEPGQTQTVAIDVPVKDLAFYDVDASTWEVEPMSYTAYVGPSSKDLPLRASFTVSGG